MKTKTIFWIALFCFTGCRHNEPSKLLGLSEGIVIRPKYAEGFFVTQYSNYSILHIKHPFPNTEKTYRYLIGDVVDVKEKQLFDGVINTPIKTIVVTSTTHVAALEALDVSHSLVGFPGLDYISSEKTRKRIKLGLVKDLGQSHHLNIELLLQCKPDLLMGFGIDNENNMRHDLEAHTIPVILNGDWVEKSPLAKAEWIKCFGILYNKEKEADAIFNEIEKNYIDAKNIAKKAMKKPTILSGALHGDTWFLPGGKTTEAVLFKDAYTQYLWQDNTSTGSLKLSVESVLNTAHQSDFWFSPSHYKTMQHLKQGHENHAVFRAFKTASVYSFVNTVGETGGVLYYEQGSLRPDIVLKDIIKICHPELLPSYRTYFFKSLK